MWLHYTGRDERDGWDGMLRRCEEEGGFAGEQSGMSLVMVSSEKPLPH
jgi:hypothetical protein